MELYYTVLVVAFVAGLLAVEAIYGLWSANRSPEARRISQRLQSMSAGGQARGEIKLLKKRDVSKLPPLERWLLRTPRIQQLDRLLVQAGWNVNVASFLLWIGVLLGLGFLAGWLLTRMWPFALGLGVLLAMLPYILLQRARAKRLNALLLQLPDALDLVARALRAGHAFSGGLKMVADETQDPIAGEFRTTFDELNFGLSLDEAMLNLAERVDLHDIKYFVISVLVQRETGGNLASILEGISRLIRDRLRLLGRIRVLSAQGRLEAWVLSILPFVVVGLMFALRPDLMSMLWTEQAGRYLSMLGMTMITFGILIMWRMVKIRI